jgi:hypothetical protein
MHPPPLPQRWPGWHQWEPQSMAPGGVHPNRVQMKPGAQQPVPQQVKPGLQ